MKCILICCKIQQITNLFWGFFHTMEGCLVLQLNQNPQTDQNNIDIKMLINPFFIKIFENIF